MINPYANLDAAYARIGMPMARAATQRRSSLTPEEEQSLLRSLGSKTLSGVGAIGSVLDLPGSMIRDVLAWKNPLDQLLSPFDYSKNRVTGRQLLEKMGVAGKNKLGSLDWGDVGGFAAEVALDPLTYMTLGGSAIGKAGQAARAAGLMDDAARVATKMAGKEVGKRQARMTLKLGDLITHADDPANALKRARKAAGGDDALRSMLDEPLGGLVGFGVPGRDAITTAGRAGGMAEKVAVGMDRLGAAIGRSPPGRAIKMLGHAPSGGKYEVFDQELAELAFKRMPEGRVAALTEHFEKVDMMGKALKEFSGVAGEQIGRAAGVTGAEAAEHTEKVFNQIVRLTGETAGDVQGALTEILPASARGAKFSNKLLGQMTEIGDSMQVANRAAKTPIEDMGGLGDWLPETEFFEHLMRYVDHGAGSGAKESLFSRTFRSMKKRHKEIATIPSHWVNKMLRDPALHGQNVKAAIKANYSQWLSPTYVKGATAAVSTDKHAKQLARWITLHGDSYVKEQKDLFVRLLGPDFLAYQTGAHKASTGLRATHELFAKHLGTEGIPVKDAFKASQMRPKKALKYMANLTGKSVDDLKALRIPEDVVSAAKGFSETYTNPQWGSKIGQWIDTATQWFKDNVTLPHPAFVSRNVVSGQTVNASSGLINGVSDFVKYQGNFFAAMRAAKNPAAHKELIREVYVHGLVGGPFGFSDASTFMTAAQRGVPANPLRLGETIAEAGQHVADKPMLGRIPGFGKARQAHQTLLRTGAKVNQWAEWANRVPMYMYLKQKGWEPAAAAKKVLELQFDYSELAPFEKTVMKRLCPFYCVPDHSDALTRDGWKTCDELVVGEDVLTYNIDSDELEWKPCLEKAIFGCDEDILVMANKRHKIEFTANHRWPIVRPKMVDNGRTYPAKRMVVEGSHLNTNHKLIVTATLSKSEPSIMSPKDARLLGWLMTDGYWRTRGNHTEAVLFQHPKKFLTEVEDVAGRKARWFHPDTGTATIPIIKERKEAILQYLNRDSLIKVVTRLSREAAEAMYDAMYKADGVTAESRTQDFFASQRPVQREAFRVLAFMLGKRTSESDRGSYVSHRRYFKVAGCTITPSHYKGRVWCPKTENGTWVMRQNGLITITGNTFSRKMAGLGAKTLAERPGGLMGQIIRGGRIGRDDSTILPEYLSQTLAIPAGQSVEGDPRFLTGFGFAHEDPLSFLGTNEGVPDIRGAGMELLSRTNPLIKGPMEYFTNESFFQRGPTGGRPLQDLDPTMGRIASNVLGLEKPVQTDKLLEVAAANSPFTRYLTTIRTLTDKRKRFDSDIPIPGPAAGVNLLSGFRISDVPQRTQETILREAATDRLVGGGIGKVFEKPWVPDDVLASLPPEKRKEVERLELLLKELGVRQQARGRGEKVEPLGLERGW